MRRFVIRRRHGHDYIRSVNDGFTLIVIPPEKQPESYPLESQVIGVSFCEDNNADLTRLESSVTYDFEGADIAYYGEDSECCNQHLWFEAIQHYCQKVLQKVPVSYIRYSYRKVSLLKNYRKGYNEKVAVINN